MLALPDDRGQFEAGTGWQMEVYQDKLRPVIPDTVNRVQGVGNDGNLHALVPQDGFIESGYDPIGVDNHYPVGVSGAAAYEDLRHLHQLAIVHGHQAVLDATAANRIEMHPDVVVVGDEDHRDTVIITPEDRLRGEFARESAIRKDPVGNHERRRPLLNRLAVIRISFEYLRGITLFPELVRQRAAAVFPLF